MGLNVGSIATGASAGSAIGGPVGGLIGGGLGLISGIFGGKDKNEMTKEDYERLREQAWGYEKEGMGLQYGYNKKAGEDEYERNLRMWNETNMEAQRKHLENANLSVGLMYGKGGAQGASTAGGSQQGVSGPKTNPSEIQLQKEALGLNAEQIKSQIKLNESQAIKNEAEATKISGADTAETKSRIEINEMNEKLMSSEIEINSANITKLVADGQIAMQQYNQELNNTEISNETKETVINQAIQDYKNSILAGSLNIANIKKAGKESELIEKNIDNYVYEIVTKRMSAEAAKENAGTLLQKIKNDYEQNGIHLDIEKERLLKEWIYGGVDGFTKVVGAAGDVAGMAAGGGMPKLGKSIIKGFGKK